MQAQLRRLAVVAVVAAGAAKVGRLLSEFDVALGKQRHPADGYYRPGPVATPRPASRPVAMSDGFRPRNHLTINHRTTEWPVDGTWATKR